MEQSVPGWFAPLVFIVWLFVIFWTAHKSKKIHDRYIEDISRVVGYRVQYIGYQFEQSNIYAEGSEARRLQRAYWRAYRRLVAVPVGLWLAIIFGGWLWETLARSFN
jgi:hypothetical protein